MEKREQSARAAATLGPGDFHVAIATPPTSRAPRGTTSPVSVRGFPLSRGGGAQGSAEPALPLSCSVIGPRLWEAANECSRREQRGQYGFPHLVTVEETVLSLMEKPRGVEVRGRGLLVTGKENPESPARWALL